jgi:hypothetical protein
MSLASCGSIRELAAAVTREVFGGPPNTAREPRALPYHCFLYPKKQRWRMLLEIASLTKKTWVPFTAAALFTEQSSF